MHSKDSTFVFEKQGDIVYCKGTNFEYAKVGETSKFTQTGKIPSIRIVKKLIKMLDS